jgi:hypothetical protein
MKGFLFTAAASLAMISSAAAALFRWSSGSGGNNRRREVCKIVSGISSAMASRQGLRAATPSHSGSGNFLAAQTVSADQAFLNLYRPDARTVAFLFFDLGARCKRGALQA